MYITQVVHRSLPALPNTAATVSQDRVGSLSLKNHRHAEYLLSAPTSWRAS